MLTGVAGSDRQGVMPRPAYGCHGTGRILPWQINVSSLGSIFLCGNCMIHSGLQTGFKHDWYGFDSGFIQTAQDQIIQFIMDYSTALMF